MGGEFEADPGRVLDLLAGAVGLLGLAVHFAAWRYRKLLRRMPALCLWLLVASDLCMLATLLLYTATKWRRF